MPTAGGPKNSMKGESKGDKCSNSALPGGRDVLVLILTSFSNLEIALLTLW